MTKSNRALNLSPGARLQQFLALHGGIVLLSLSLLTVLLLPVLDHPFAGIHVGKFMITLLLITTFGMAARPKRTR